MPFIEYENDNLPLSNLPYAFKRRLIQLSPLADSTIISTAWSDLGTLSHRRRECLHKIFITDDKNVCKFAKEELSNFGHVFDVPWVRYFSDSPFTIDPTWQSVLLLDEIVAKNRSFVVDDTLVLYFTSTESYDQLIPLMVGSYSRLVIYGQFSWAQVKHLIHDNVKKVRIMGRVEVKRKEYDDVVRFVLRFARGIEYKFSFHEDSFPPGLTNQLNEACKNHESFKLVTTPANQVVHFVDKGSVSACKYKLKLSFVCSMFIAFFNCFFVDFYPGERLILFHTMLLALMVLCVFLTTTMKLISNSLSEQNPKDIKLHASIVKSL